MLNKVSLPLMLILVASVIVFSPGTILAQTNHSPQAQDGRRIFHYQPKGERYNIENKQEEDASRRLTVIVPGPGPFPSSSADYGPVYYGHYDRFGDWHSYGHSDMGGYWHADQELVPLNNWTSSWF